MKAVQSRNIAMSDMFRALAGAPEAQFDVIACTVYSAAYSVMQAGNKTQFLKLQADAAMYGADTSDANKACKDAVGAKTLNAAAKHYKKVYAAIGITLAEFGIPEMQKDLPKGKDEQYAILDPLASDYADQFAMNFTALMAAPALTEDERAAQAAAREAKKAEKEAAAAKAEKEAERAARQQVEAEVVARVERATSDDAVVSSVIGLLSAGMLPADLEAALIEAVRTRETALLLARAAAPATEPEPA